MAALYAEVESEHAIHVIEFDEAWTKLGIGINTGSDCRFTVWNFKELMPDAQGTVRPQMIGQKDFDEDQIYDITFDRRGEIKVTAMQSQSANLFNLTNLEEVPNSVNASEPELMTTLPHANTSVTKIKFSPDNQKVATAANDGNARLWDVSKYAEFYSSSTVTISGGIKLITAIAIFMTSLFY